MRISQFLIFAGPFRFFFLALFRFFLSALLFFSISSARMRLISKADSRADRSILALLSADQEHLVTSKLMTSQVVERLLVQMSSRNDHGHERVNDINSKISETFLSNLNVPTLSEEQKNPVKVKYPLRN